MSESPKDDALADRSSTDELIARILKRPDLIRNQYPLATRGEPVTFRPGDVVVSTDTGHMWWVHGHPGMELHLTSTAGVCASIPDAEQRCGKLVLRCRPSDHQPERSSVEHP